MTSDPNDDALRAAIVEALQTGPASPKDVTTKVGADKLAVRFAFKELLASGRVKAEGSTGNRKWMLARTQSRPAKEAP